MTLVDQLDDLELSACQSGDARIGSVRIYDRGQPPEERACDLRRAKDFATQNPLDCQDEVLGGTVFPDITREPRLRAGHNSVVALRDRKGDELNRRFRSQRGR